MSDVDAVAARLEQIVEDLDEMMFDRLREAVADGATARPMIDRDLTKARRATEKAANILRNIAR